MPGLMNASAISLRGFSHALPALLVVTLALPLLATDVPSPKDHSLFVGLDVSVARKAKFYRVIGAQKNALQIMVDRQVVTVPLAEAKDLRLDRGVKLSNLSASVTNLHGAVGASRLQAAAETEAISSSMFIQDMMEDKRDKVLGDAVWAPVLGQKTDGTTTPSNAAEQVSQTAQAQLPELQNSINRAALTGSDLITGRSGPEGGLNDTGFVVSFEAAAPVTLEQCHVAVIADYTLPGDSNATFSSVTLEPLGALGPAGRKFSCKVRRFPPGAQLVGYRLALYSRGQEIATNLSTRRTDITRDEAVLYLTLDHLTKHAGETLPPAPVLMVPRSEFVSRLHSAPLDQVIYARVGKDGKIIGLSADATGSVHLPVELSSCVDQIAFVPALEKGKPVEGVAKFKLADLVARN